MTPDVILNDISHANLLLYSAAIPPIDTDGDEVIESNQLDELDWGGRLDMSNPENFKDTDDQRKRI